MHDYSFTSCHETSCFLIKYSQDDALPINTHQREEHKRLYCTTTSVDVLRTPNLKVECDYGVIIMYYRLTLPYEMSATYKRCVGITVWRKGSDK